MSGLSLLFPCLLLPALLCADRWNGPPADGRNYARLLAGAALSDGPSPAAWSVGWKPQLTLVAANDIDRLQSLALDVLAAPLPRDALSLTVSLGQANQPEPNPRRSEWGTDGRLGMGWSHRFSGVDSTSLGASLAVINRMQPDGAALGLGAELGLRQPLPGTDLSLGAWVHDVDLASPGLIGLAREVAVGLAWERGDWEAAADLAVAALASGVGRFTVGWRALPWLGLRLGASTPEADGDTPQLGLGAEGAAGSFRLAAGLRWRSLPAMGGVHLSLSYLLPAPAPAGPTAPGPSLSPQELQPLIHGEADGTFAVLAEIHNGRVDLSWPDAPDGDSYAVLVGLIEGAIPRRISPDGLHQRTWSAVPDLRGATYFYTVEVYDDLGKVLARSSPAEALVPLGVKP